MNRKVLEIKLSEIDIIIKSKYKEETHIGALVGLSGLALFQFYYSKYLNSNDNADIGFNILDNCTTKINDGYELSTFCEGIAGFGWTLDHLEQEEFLEINNDEFLSNIDAYLYNRMISKLKKEDYDFLHGAIGYAFYFLKRYKNTKSMALKNKYKKILNEFIDLIEKLAVNDNSSQLKWASELDSKTKKRGYNLSLSHGMSSIIGILTKLYLQEDFKDKTEDMLKKAINYIMSFISKNKNSLSLFPNLVPFNIKETNECNYNSRIAWCYGDLGIGIRFWYASKALKDKKLKETSLNIMKHAAKRITPNESKVLDSGICHGSFGNAQIFNRIYKETGYVQFKKAADFWIEDGLSRAIFKDGYAGYKQWYGKNKKWDKSTSLLEGIAGIGLVIIDYLCDFDTTWDECLMIS